MPTFLVLLANVTVALRLVLTALRRRPHRSSARRSVGLAALPLAAAGLLAAYVFGEDGYRGHGISRWDAYRSPGGALGSMFVVSVALMAAWAALLLLAGVRGHPRLLRSTAAAAGLTGLLLLTPTIVGFSAASPTARPETAVAGGRTWAASRPVRRSAPAARQTLGPPTWAQDGQAARPSEHQQPRSGQSAASPPSFQVKRHETPH